MATTTNQDSLLYQLRSLVPRRPLTQFEAYRIAELQANRLLRWGGVTEPGTPDSLVTNLPFLDVVERSDLPVSGLTNWYKPRWLILLNRREPAVRRRFSLMHEFKHVLDHEAIGYLYSSDRQAELSADAFAAAVLMPKRLIKRRFGEGLQDPADLAAEFGVSEVAMRFRLQQLGLLERTRRCDHAYQPLPNSRTTYFRQAWTAESVRLVGAAA